MQVPDEVGDQQICDCPQMARCRPKLFSKPSLFS